MISFGELAEARRGTVQRIVEPFAVPVFRQLPDGEPDFLCSGFFLPLGDHLVLISAGHAFDVHPPTLILDTGRVHKLENDVCFGKATLGYGDPLNDVASILLTREEAAEVAGSAIAPLSAVAPFEYRTPANAYIVYGFRDRVQKLDHAEAMFYHQCTSVMVSPADEDQYRSHLPTDKVLLLGTSPRSFKTPAGRGGVPKLRGMSGSPVWRYNPIEDYSVQNVPRLVAMLVGQPAHTKNALMAVRMTVILEHLSLAYPVLGPLIPRFRAG